MSAPSPRVRDLPAWMKAGFLPRWPDMLLAAAAASAALLVAHLGERLLALEDLSPIFLLTVLLVAVRARGGAAVLTALLSFLGWNWFFTEPRHTLWVQTRQDVLHLLLFLVVALISSRLAWRLRRQVAELRTAHAGIEALQSLARALLLANDPASVASVASSALGRAAGCQASVRLAEAAGSAGEVPQFAAQPGLPLQAGESRFGEVRFAAAVPAERWPLLARMADDVAAALARLRLAAELERARRQSETDQLRNALLSSVSHDLRSPLSTIVGAAESLIAWSNSMPEEDRRSLLESILGEGQRLDRYIQNLLDMARLGHGELHVHRDWVAPADLLGAAVRRARRQFPGIEFVLDVPRELPLLWVHPALVEQALFNILENAARFSPEGGPVRLGVRADERQRQLCIEVLDRGPGIPEEERLRIFDPFHSVARGDRGQGGTGLGLSICQGLVGAHGGQVEALPGADGTGTLMVVRLPLATPPDDRRSSA